MKKRATFHDIFYVGSRAQLIEAGILTPDDPLPGEPGQHKTYARYPEDDPRRIVCVWPRPGGRFRVMVKRTEHYGVRPSEGVQADTEAKNSRGETSTTVSDSKRTHLRLVWSDGRPV